MNSAPKNSNHCTETSCTLPKYDGKFCILHTPSFEKDEPEFSNALNLYIKSRKAHFNNIYFPFPPPLDHVLNENIQFFQCHFNCEINISGKSISKNFIFDSCHFYYNVFLCNCTFNDLTLFRGNKFHASFSLNKSSFNARADFDFNKFKHGINLHRIQFNKDKGLTFRSCKMGASFLFESDIENINFISCDWEKKYLLAEEIYDVKLNTKYGLMGVPYNYLNQLLKLINRLFPKIDFLLKLLYRKEYNRQRNLRKKDSGFCITSTGWNNCKMAEDTYRKLKLRYTKQAEPEIAGKFYFREKVNQRKTKNCCKRIWAYVTREFLFGFGEKPIRVLINSILLIIGFAGIYYCSDLLQFKNASIACSEIGNNFLTSIYFSIVTFTTLGYGDCHPTGWLRLVSSFEALLGTL